MLAEPVLEQAQKDMMCYGTSGMSVMEMTSRSKMYIDIYDRAVADLRELMAIPDDYEVLFLQGGATQQFSAVPLNLMVKGKADYVDSGNFAHLAAEEGKRYGEIHVVASPGRYVHLCARLNQRAFRPRCGLCPHHQQQYHLWHPVCGTSAGDPAFGHRCKQHDSLRGHGCETLWRYLCRCAENIGPSGLCVVIVRKDLLGHAMPICPKLLNWEVQAKAGSMYNTPNTWGIYVAGLTFQWLKAQGGVAAMEQRNIEKAALLYDFLDNSRLFKPTARKNTAAA